jgi:hypothetical protein
MSEDTPDFSALTEEGKALDAVLGDLERSAGRFGTAMTTALASAVRGGKGLDDILKGTALRLVDIALSAGLKPLQDGVSSGIGTLIDSLGKGAASLAAPLARNGTIATPAPLAGLSALGREAAQGGSGTGLRQAGAGGMPLSGGAPFANVTFNVTASDVDSFRRSEGQIAAMLTRTVGRGRRGV